MNLPRIRVHVASAHEIPRSETTASANLRGVAALASALLVFSLQDVAVKWIGGAYPVMQIALLRSVVALPCTIAFLRYEGARGLPNTRQHKLQYLRGFLLFLSFTTYMMAIAALPLADISAIRNSGPLVITLLSVVWLGEKVGPHRWLALLVGFGGVLLIVRPGSATFDPGSVFALLATLFYALSVMITRTLRATDSSATMAYYSSWVYLVAGLALAPVAILVGEAPDAHPSVAFFLRAWAMPTVLDLAIMCGLGLIWTAGMYLMTRAYSLAEASVAAPFEYSTLLYNVVWGLVLWQEIPTLLTLAGALLTLSSGIYIWLRERRRLTS